MNEERYPHALDVLEREYSENGFARGWAMHQKPVPDYYFDAHLHYQNDNLGPYMEKALELDIMRANLIIKIHGGSPGELEPYADPDVFAWLNVDEVSKVWDRLDKERFFWTAWIDHREPRVDLVNAASDAGAQIIKLHNAPVIETNTPYDIWLSKAWQDVFAAMDKRKMPCLFHVTQRLPSSRYTGGGRNTYWAKGWENGVTYGNEDLLQAFLICVRRYPNIDFIGAHQLHIGWDRLEKLFIEFPNLYVDTSIGCTLRLYDDFYPHDKEYLRRIFIKWADRIIFGSDCFWGMENGKVNDISQRQHKRFITALDLPEDVLNKICRSNIERICNIQPM